MLLLFFSSVATSQAITYDTTIAGWNVRVTYRPSADSTEGIIFMPGVGEVGRDAGKLQLYGPHYWLNHGWDGSVVLGNGVHYPILVSIQQPTELSRPSTVKPVIDGILRRYKIKRNALDGILRRYKIKRNALHFTALSQGCWVLNHFLSYKPSENDFSYMSMVRSMVNVEGMNPADQFGASLPFPQKMGHWAKRFGGKELGFEQVHDTRNINRIISNMNDSVPGSGNLLFTEFGAGGHSNFNDFYNPAQNNWTLSNPNVLDKKGSVYSSVIAGGQNVWQWMLRQGDTAILGAGSPQGANLPPVVSAGVDQTISLPIALVT
ncbi:MAG: hypothetical protein EOO05_15555, partial [Chitinophagaceae bacterium]